MVQRDNVDDSNDDKRTHETLMWKTDLSHVSSWLFEYHFAIEGKMKISHMRNDA